MNTTTRGFSSLILLLALAAVVLVGGGYWISKNLNVSLKTPTPGVATTTQGDVISVPPNGTSQSKTSAVNSQSAPDTSGTLIPISEDAKYSVALRVYGANPQMGQLIATIKKTGVKVALGDPIKDAENPVTSPDSLGIKYGTVYEGDDQDKYLLLDTGGSLGRGVSVFSVATGKQLAGLCSYYGGRIWQDVLIYNDCDENQVPDYGFEVGVTDIRVKNLITGETKVLVPAKINGAYYFIRPVSVSGDQLQYKSASVIKSGQGSTYDQASAVSKSINLRTALASWL